MLLAVLLNPSLNRFAQIIRMGGCVLVFAALVANSAQAETTKPQLIDLAEGPDALKDLAPRTVAEVLDAITPETNNTGDGTPRVRIAIDGEVYPGSWRKLEGHVTQPEGAAKESTVSEYEWIQKAGPKTLIPETFFKNAGLWLFLIKPGNYSFTFRAKNEKGWSAAAEVRFVVMQGRPYLSERDGFQRVGSCERVVLPGKGWRQIAGPEAAFRPAEDGMAVRLNDAGLYVFEASRLEDGLTERRGILVPPGKDGVLGDRRPIAILPKTLSGVVGRPVILDGTLSSDLDVADTLTARWSTPDYKNGATIDVQPGLRAAFKAERAGIFSAVLIVSDGRLDSLPATVTIDILPSDGTSDENDGAGDGLPDDLNGVASAKDLLQRRVALAIWPPEPLADGTLVIPDDSGLQRAVALFTRRCNVALVVDPGIARPGHFNEFPLALEAANTPLRHLLDGIARQTNTRYRRDADRAFFLMKPGDSFRDEKLESVAAGIDALHEKPDASDVMDPLRDYFKTALTREGATFTFEADQQALFAMLPRTAAQRMREIVQALREPHGTGIPWPEGPTKAEEKLRQILGEKTITLRGRYRLDRLLRELGKASGLAMGFDPKTFPGALPYLKINYDGVVLRQVLRDVVADAGFDGCSVEAPAGLWFYKGPRPFPTGELLWDSAEVRAYDLSTMLGGLSPEASLFLTGETIAHQIRSHIYPASWNDPGPLIFYHRMTQKLIIVHAPEAHRKIVDYLNDLRERGPWAFGPLE